MAADRTDVMLLDESRVVTLADLLACSGLTEAELRELVDEGALAPEDTAAPAWTFRARSVVVVREVTRLRREFALDDLHSACVVLADSERVAALERELKRRGG